jgi:hypothetical protein
MPTTKLLVYLAVWKRPHITEICFNGIKRMQTHPDYDIQAVAVISEVEMIPLCEKYGVNWVMADNKPLGRKKNTGLQFCKQFDFDYLMEIGSDDLITNRLLTHYKEFLSHGFFGVRDLAYIDSESGECRRLKSKTTFGAGRIISRSYLDKCGWQLWKDHLNKGLDNNSILKFAHNRIGYKMVPEMDRPGVIDLKSSTNIWKFNRGLGEPYDKNLIFDDLSNVEIEMIEACYK